MGARSSSQATALDSHRHVRLLDPVVRRRLYRPLRSIIQLTLLLVLLGFGGDIRSDAQATGAVIDGTITDAQGAALSTVTVTVRNAETGVTRTEVTGAGGRYRIEALQPGSYELQAEADGFAVTDVKNILLTVGLEFQKDVVLGVGNVQQSVLVSADPVITEPTSSQVGSALISQEQINSLPIPNRQAMQLALLLPGTGTDVTRATRPNANVGAGDVNAAGSIYLLDGLSNMISGLGDPRDNMPEASVQEFKVILSQSPAEYGTRAGGVVTLVTKSGGNQIHGEAFEYFRDHYINRVDYYTQLAHDRNPTTNPIEPFNRNQLGGAAGGPILKDRLHYFGSFEYTNDQEYFTVAPGVSKGVQNSTVKEVYASLEGSFRGGSLAVTYFGKLDWQINPNQSAYFKFYEQSPYVYYSYGCAGGNSAAFSCGDSNTNGWTWSAGHTWLLSPRIVNQLRAQVAQDWQNSPIPKFNTPAQFKGEAGTTTYTFPNMTWGFYPGTAFHPFYQEAREDLSINVKEHTFKTGADILNTPRNTDAPTTPLGAWTFKNDFVPTATSPTFDPNNPNFDWASLVNSSPSLYTTKFPPIYFQDKNLMSALYFQDEWKLRRNLTLNLGVRYDLQTKVWRNSLKESLYPKPLPYVTFGGHSDYNNVAPRLGFAWDPRTNGKTVVRGGFGIVYVDLQDDAFQGEISALRQTSISIKNPSYPDPYNGEGYQAYVSTAPPNISINANDIRNPKVSTTSLGFSRELAPNLALNVDGIYTHISQLEATVQVNTPAATGLRPLPAWGYINQSQPIGTYGYRGLYVRLDKRYARRYQFMVSYTLAKQNDNYNGSTAITDFYHPSEDLGTAVTDRRHNLVSSGSVLTRYGVTVGGIWTVRSALPFNALAGIDLNDDGATTDYVPGTIKNSRNIAKALTIVNAWRSAESTSKTTYAPIPLSQIQNNHYNQLDARISKQFSFGERYKLQAIGQLFNVFGKDNFGGVGSTQQSNALSSTFGTIASALPRQQGELAVRFVF